MTWNICFKAVKHFVFYQRLLFWIHLFLNNAEKLQAFHNIADVDGSLQPWFQIMGATFSSAVESAKCVKWSCTTTKTKNKQQKPPRQATKCGHEEGWPPGHVLETATNYSTFSFISRKQ